MVRLSLRRRPKWVLAYLRRTNQGEIVVRRAGVTESRRCFPMADVTWETTDRAAGELLERWGFRASGCTCGDPTHCGTAPQSAVCPICHRQGCDSSLANCIERWR